MSEGDIILAQMAQADNTTKIRPALVLRIMPRFGDLLLCGISTQLRQAVQQFDEIISQNDQDFSSSGLKSVSLIRLGFVSLMPASKILGRTGFISSERHRRLLEKLCNYLLSKPA